MLKKTILILVLLSIVFVGSVQAADHKLSIGATPVPHAEILDFIRTELKAAGIDLDLVEFTDYVTPNIALADGSIDANFFQHIPYLKEFNKNRALNLKAVIKVHLEPIALYSEKYNSLEEIPAGAQIAIPNDPSNEGRALILLDSKGLISLKDPNNLNVTPVDIKENPKNLKFKELGAAQLPRVLNDVAAAIINTNYALEADLNPVADALLIEGKNSPYVNVIAVRAEDKDSQKIKILKAVIQSEAVKEFILEEYEGAVVPAFEPLDSGQAAGAVRSKTGDYIF
ncbi:MetQ/NlpA family ABC transporter substrate-binding protein [Halanaerobium praevalens]|uniref:Lipoprotein n=1 Tax=Halanaerobium praevalens (strain ATCC 33744 / DSM 2228 / GSL) TaxID=572479 RepID=E3DQN8_HALPG|nr:MetQ/NlpA family ABC transporter substrate-binding protein [Halanaerobium praevalens]ADO77949.1 NLPA lipoprotein [Halanaerobium praevalens DSM 2228]